MRLLKNYKTALQAIYDHVGLVEDWVVCPIDDQTEMYWRLASNTVSYAETREQLEDDSRADYCQDDIYTQRFYEKQVYKGKDVTLVFCDPHVDGMKWWRIFDNTKCII